MSEKPDLYLDVDGVMLLFGNGKEYVNLWLLNLIVKNRGQFDRIFWLSCWTLDGKTDRLLEEHPELGDLKATPLKWQKDKTDAIDWTRPFIWIEDGISEKERKDFNEKGCVWQQVWEIRNNFNPRIGKTSK